MLLAFLGPPVLGFIFMPVFSYLQSLGWPSGNLEGVDLTRFAERDAWVFRAFALVLIVYAIANAACVRPWSSRIATLVVGAAAAAVTLFVVFFSLMAP